MEYTTTWTTHHLPHTTKLAHRLSHKHPRSAEDMADSLKGHPLFMDDKDRDAMMTALRTLHQCGCTSAHLLSGMRARFDSSGIAVPHALVFILILCLDFRDSPSKRTNGVTVDEDGKRINGGGSALCFATVATLATVVLVCDHLLADAVTVRLLRMLH